MKGYITFNGTEDKISDQIADIMGLSGDDSYRMLYFLVNNQYILSPEESAALAKSNVHSQRQMTFGAEKYYVNVKVTTIILCAFLLDITLTQGAVSAIFSLVGMPTKAIVKLDGKEGEKCVLRETLRLKNKTGNAHILDKFKGQCSNNDILNCKYRTGMQCNCHPEQVEDIFRKLTESNVFVRDAYGNYRYCW